MKIITVNESALIRTLVDIQNVDINVCIDRGDVYIPVTIASIEAIKNIAYELSYHKLSLCIELKEYCGIMQVRLWTNVQPEEIELDSYRGNYLLHGIDNIDDLFKVIN